MNDTMQVKLNGQRSAVAHGMTIADLLEQLQVEPRHVAVEVNLQLVPREVYASHRLTGGDTIEIVTLVGGG